MMNEAFQVKSKNELFNRNSKPVKQGNESMLCLAPKIWLVVPWEIKSHPATTCSKLKIETEQGVKFVQS